MYLLYSFFTQCIFSQLFALILNIDFTDIPEMSLTFENIERELKPVLRWHRLGTNLGIPQEILKAIKLDNTGTCNCMYNPQLTINNAIFLK